MSLLDDARKMQRTKPRPDFLGMCWFCDGRESVDTPGLLLHESDCPWLSMPKIVAALEAADRLIDRGGEDDQSEWIALSKAMEGRATA